MKNIKLDWAISTWSITNF